jgi:hypothetical protein
VCIGPIQFLDDGDLSDDGESEVDQLSDIDTPSPRDSSPDTDIDTYMRSSSPDPVPQTTDRLGSPFTLAGTERLGSPFTPARASDLFRSRPMTYLKRDRKLAEARRAVVVARRTAEEEYASRQRIAAQEAAKTRKKVPARLRMVQPGRPVGERRSRRTRRGRRGDNTDNGVFLAEDLTRAGNAVHAWLDE